MQVTKLSQKILSNKSLLKGLEKISQHGTSFSAGTSLLMSVALRPLAIRFTPDTENENKHYAMANSICSGLTKFAIVEAIALPVEHAIKKIDKNPDKFLSAKTIKKLTKSSDKLVNSRSYNLITQTLKLSTGFITAIPKSLLTVALIPIVMDKMFSRSKNEKVVFNNSIDLKESKIINFTGRISNNFSKMLGKFIDNNSIQNWAAKFENKDKDIPKHITAATDILLTASSSYYTQVSDGIKDNRKKALIYNNIISTGITVIGGYIIDAIAKNKSDGFIDKFSKINAKDPKLAKYIEGINILRPAIIFAGIYYGILPIFSTYMSEKIDKFILKKQNSNQ